MRRYLPFAQHALVLALTVLVHMCQCWSYSDVSTFGPTRWVNYFPRCNETLRAQSPIALTAAERTSATPTDFSLSFHRLIDATTEGVNFQTGLNTGGLLTAFPSSPFPMVLRREDQFVSQSTVYLNSIVYHSSAEHTGALSVTAQGEVQYVFAPTPTGEPTMIVAQPMIVHAAATASSDTSIAMLLLSRLGAYLSSTQTGGNTLNYVTPQMPYLFLNSSSAMSTRAIVYQGTTSWPPCFPVQVVVSLSPATIPTSLFLTIFAAGNQVRTARPAQSRSAVPAVSYAQLLQGSALNSANVPLFTPAPTRYVNQTILRIVGNPQNEYMMDAIIGLVALNGVLVLCIGVLLLARLEYIEWPMWLGGLRRPVEWWTNPRSFGDFEVEEEDYSRTVSVDDDEHEEAEEDFQAPRAEAA